MIASLRGEVIHIALDHAVVECSGVGYKVLATPATLSTFVRGDVAFVLTSMVVREDSMTLYGFADSADREMFHLLQTVSGMGAKLAMAALAVFTAAEIGTAIASGDAKSLQKIPGVGKRMAERLALELGDKVGAVVGEAVAPAPNVSVPAGSAALIDQVTEALIGLGFAEKSARPTVESIVASTPDAPTAVVLKLALAQLGKK